jgi:hypothetical protein
LTKGAGAGIAIVISIDKGKWKGSQRSRGTVDTDAVGQSRLRKELSLLVFIGDRRCRNCLWLWDGLEENGARFGSKSFNLYTSLLGTPR